MEKTKAKSKNKLFLIVFIVLISLVFTNLPVNLNTAQAATNLIQGGSFENNIESYWSLWQGEGQAREYELFRSFEVPFGYGSYSAGIEASG